MTMNKKSSIAVVGAGLSGLACATQLQAAGWQVSVFDKSRGPSGRMSTRRAADWQCDHGAQYFTARDGRFQAEVERWQAAGAAALWQPRLAVLGDEDRHQSDGALLRFVGVPSMTAPGRFLADALALTTQCTINSLEKTPSGWQIGSQEHGRLAGHYDAVVLALPAPQAVPLLQTIAPDLAEVASQAVMRPAWALMLRYPAVVDLPFDAAFVNHGPLRWLARESSKPGRTTAPETWLLHATPDWSQTHLEADPEWVAVHLLAAFVDLGAPLPQAWSAHRWRYADTAKPLQQGCCWDSKQSIGLCGDWLNAGKVEGAWLSGVQLAEHIAAE